MITNPCTSCSGQGFVRQKKTLTVTIPAGIGDGVSLRVTGEGESLGSTPGDLYVRVSIKAHNLFKREGRDVLYNAKIDLYTAVLGGKIEVPTLDGKVSMSIPEGTQPLSVFRLKGKGFSNVRSSIRGDQFVRVNIEIPKKLSSKEKALFKELNDLKSNGSFKEKVKKVFS